MIRPEMLTNKWPQRPLGEVVDFLDHLRRPITAKDREPGPYPYYGANGQQDSVANYIFDQPLVLLAEDGGNFGDPDRNIAYRVDGKCWVNNHAHVLKPKEMIDIDFLCRTLEKYDVSKFINGATRAKLNKGIAATIPIPPPPLPEQRRIAAILDKADAIRRKRQQAIRLTEDFLRSVFLDMFGDPVTNPKGWEVKPLDELSFRITDGAHKTPTYTASGVPFLSAKNINRDRIQWESHKYVSKEEHEKLCLRCKPEKGDLLLTKSGTIGRVAVVDTNKEFSLFESVALIKLSNDNIDKTFLSYVLNSDAFSRLYLKDTKGVAIKHLHLVNIRTLPIIMPPLYLQIQFLDVLRVAFNNLLGDDHLLKTTEDLFSSLVQRAFRGDL